MKSAPRFAPPLFVPERVDRTQKADRRRLRRTKDRSRKASERPPIAKIIILEAGGYWRPVITRGSLHRRFRMPSRKNGLTQVGEGWGELRLALLNEIDGWVWDYQNHPWQIIGQVNGRRFKYRPDAIRVLIDGTIEVIEVKRTFEDLSDLGYREILGQVREICRQCGCRFRVMYLDDIIPNEDHKDNVDILSGRRHMTLTKKQERDCCSMRLAGNTLVWSEARDRLATKNVLEGNAILECAAAQGMFVFDLAEPRTDRTVLMPVKTMTGPSPIRP